MSPQAATRSKYRSDRRLRLRDGLIGRGRLVILLAAAAVWIAPAAHAKDYCVAPNASCGGTNVATFQAALDAADNAVDADRIFLGAATYTASASTGFAYDESSSPVEIAGAGRGQTILTGPIGGSESVLLVKAGSASSIHDLTVRLPQNAASSFVGLVTHNDATRIEVIEAASQANTRTGVELYEGASLAESTVTIGGAQYTFGVAFAAGGGALRGSTVHARIAVASFFGGSVEQSVLHAEMTGIQANHDTTITDCLIRVTEFWSTAINGDTRAGAGQHGRRGRDHVDRFGNQRIDRRLREQLLRQRSEGHSERR